MINVAIVGSTGYIAEYVIKALLKEVKKYNILRVNTKGEEGALKLDLRAPEEFDYAYLNKMDYVVYTAAISSPDRCELEYDNCWNINVTGTKYFIEQAISRKCRVVFFSSDAVYGSSGEKIYNELSPTQAKTAYGRMKKSIEDTFADKKDFKSVRLSYVVSIKDRFCSYCLDCINKKEVAEIFHPFYRNCITVSDVVEVVLWVLNHWEAFTVPVLNVTGEELVSRLRIADEINRIYDSALRYRIVMPDKEFYRNRPQITQVESLYLRKYSILENVCFTHRFRKEWEESKK